MIRYPDIFDTAMLNRSTIIIIPTALALAIICILPATNHYFPIWPIAAGANIADTMFHEIGHSIFGWLMGVPNIPSVFTLFGTEQAAGLTLMWPRSWIVQVVVFAGLIYGCYWIYQNFPGWLWVAVSFTLLVIITAFTPYTKIPIFYMGHGGAIAMGGFFLFRAWANMAARNGYERWLNAFFGFFMILKNIYFAWLLTDPDISEEYSSRLIGGISHHDFAAMHEIIHSWTVHGIALFTIFYGVVMIIVSFLGAVYKGMEAEINVPEEIEL